uniref:Uncharacterized protein n=2 Tax=Picea TaxID=3328 RepID=A0A117NH87_PICGL|nr:hypothetical protein ABT39_MTgene4940 [Picea glauca]QHR92896.1 hypothetical protein Q903MT_gene6945 [Picea sitchensis]
MQHIDLHETAHQELGTFTERPQWKNNYLLIDRTCRLNASTCLLISILRPKT